MKSCLFGRTLLYALILVSISFKSYSQNNAPAVGVAPSIEPCGFDQLHQEKLMNDPVYQQNTTDFNTAMQSYNPDGKVSNTPYRIPVVVHVMETGNSLTQITDAQIREGIKQLNERYRKVPGSPGDGNGVDVELEFALAVRDPNGNCTDGIVRYDMTGDATYMASGVFRQSSGISDAALKAYSFWNSFNYYNIWLVSEVDNNNGGSGIQGYAYFASAHGQSYDGAVILCNNWKDASSTTGTHELGHAFNLYHTFEGDGGGGSCPPNGNCTTQGDLVCDTPPHQRSSSDCVVGTNGCDGGSSTNLFIHNYMDYSSDACQSEFTAGQKTRVSLAMTTIRTSFLESNGNLSLVPPTVPSVAFESSNSFVCSGSDIQFYDLSGCTPNTFLDSTYWTGITFNWTFTSGATVLNSTLQNPLMNLPNGVWDVSLSVTNGSGTASHTELGFVVVGASPIGACATGSTNECNCANTVNNVSFNTISNGTSSSANVAYTDFSCTANTVVTEGTTHQMDIDLRAGGSGAEVVEVYIDYNNSGTFEAGELVLSGTTGGPSTTATITANVVIPTNAVENTLLRMRVYGEAGSISNNERTCASNFFIGDVEDYGVYIMSACVTPTISVSATSDATSCGATDGTITISGTGSGVVSWTGAAAGNSGTVTLPYIITGLGAGSYDVTFDNGCVSNTVSATLSEPGTSATPVVTVVDNCGSSVLTTSGTNLVWSTTETTSSITVSTGGTYTVTQTVGGCTSLPGSGVAAPLALPAITSGTVTDPASCGASDGSIVITGTGTGVVSWTGTASGNSGTVTLPYTITGLGAGSYDVTFDDGCTSNTVSETLSDPSAPAAPVVTVVDGCGSSTLTTSGTNLVWSTTETTSSITVLTGGSYTVTQTVGGCTSLPGTGVANPTAVPSAPVVTVVDGCSSSTLTATGTNLIWSTTETTSSITVSTGGVYTVNQTVAGCTSTNGSGAAAPSSVPTIASGTVTDPTICGGSDGSIVVTGSGTGVVSWTGTATGNSGSVTLPYTITGLSAGNYDVTFDDGCASNTVSETLSDPGAPAAPVVTVVDNCGTSTLTTTGTNLVWSTTETTPSITVSTGGSYTVTQTVGGCESLPGTGVANPTAIPVAPVVTVVDGCGTSTLTTTGTNLLWSTTETTPSITVSTGGSFTVTQTVGGCESLPGTGVANPTAIPASPVVTVVDDCGVSTLTGTGTNLIWSTTETTSSITVSTVGPYTVTQTVGGCTSLPGTGVANPTAIPAAPVVTVVDDCGTSTLTATGTNLLWSTTETTPSITVSSGGSYTVTQTVGGCTSLPGTGVANPIAIPASPVVTVVDDCGVSTLTATGTNLVWSTTETTASITVSTAGPYTVTQTVGGCTSLPGTGVANPTAIPAAPVITVVDGCGTSTLTAAGINLVWSTTETTPSITVSTAGTYTVTQTVVGCTGLPGTGVANPTAIPAAPVVTVVDDCGVSTLTATGTNLLWSTTETTPTITVSAGGSYTVTQTVGGCESLPGTGVANPTAIPASPVVTVVDDCGISTLTATGTNLVWSTTETTATIAVSTAGPYTVTQTVGGCVSLPGTGIANPTAIPAAPVVTVVDGCPTSTLTATGTNLVWSTTETTASITVSTPGAYTVTQTVGGCISLPGTGSANPGASPVIASGTIMDPTTCSGTDGSIVITGTGTGIVSWTGTATGNSGTITLPYTITGLGAGSYDITLDNGCVSNIVSETLSDPTTPSAPVVTAVDDCGSSTLTATGTNLVWSTTETTTSITVIAAGPYTVTQSVNGCISLPGTGVANPAAVPASPVVTVVDDCGSSTLTTSGTNLLWSTTETTPVIVVTVGGIYTVTETVGGCASLPAAVTANPVAIPAAPVATVVDGCGTSTLTATGTDLLWSTTETTSTILVSTAGNYTVTQTVSGCESPASTVSASPLAVPAVPVVTANGVTTFCAGGSVDLTSSNATNNLWSTTETTQTISVTASGSYDVTFTDGNGCTSTSTPLVVTVNAAPAVSVGPYTDLCNTDPFFTMNGGSPSGGTYTGPGMIGGIFDPATAGAGTHTITYQFTDGNGCADSASTTITIQDCIGLNEFNDIDLTIYPNPASDFLTLETNGVIIEVVNIYDAAGRLVQSITSNTATLQLETSSMSTGMYTVEVIANGSVYRDKVLKQ